MNKRIILIVTILALLILAGIFIILRSPEDDWIKDSRGVWVEHGAPSSIPGYVTEQQNAIACAKDLYNTEKNKGVVFESQCLGSCYDFAVDIVHIPRTAEDNLDENQCGAFRNEIVSHFIELDKDGNIVRIV
jgi:hypothetical protein